jgi:predicted metal-dependent phosphoesterase TrpH
MNETPARLLAMLTQTREDLWQAAKALTERGIAYYPDRLRYLLSRRADRAVVYAAVVRHPVDVYWPFLLDDWR